MYKMELRFVWKTGTNKMYAIDVKNPESNIVWKGGILIWFS